LREPEEILDEMKKLDEEGGGILDNIKSFL
jgi:hypothetical protein